MIRNGNEDVFKAFFKAEFDNLVHFVGSFLKDDYFAQDIAQESFMALWNTRENLDLNYSVRTYLYTIAKNKSLNHLRNSYRKMNKTSLKAREVAQEINNIQETSLMENIETMDLKRYFHRIYLSLPDKLKETFIMSREYGLSYKEIADAQGISVKSVEYRISTVLKQIQKKSHFPITDIFVVGIFDIIRHFG